MRRRAVLAGAGSCLIGGAARAAESINLPSGLSAGAAEALQFARPPDKRRMIELSARPPNYATPIEVFIDPVTPNERFFVSYRAAEPPTKTDLYTWRLEIGGDGVKQPLRLSLNDLQALPQVDMLAVCESAGNRRGLITPHVAGLQWPDGAVGCAEWTGPALRDVLNPAGISADAIEVWAEGADEPPEHGVPRFRKSIPLAKALDTGTIVALSINNAPLPLMNGQPARLVVPGWAGTYWLKHLTRLTVSTAPLLNYWMSGTDRLPYRPDPKGQPFPSQVSGDSVPLTRIVPNSMVADPLEGQQRERSGFTIHGVAWDGGSGISRVDVSLDGGKTWWEALLSQVLGPYAFRRFSLETGWLSPGAYQMMSRATNNDGEQQPMAWRPNPGGYFNNAPRAIPITVR